MRLAVEILQKNLPLAVGVIFLFFIVACSDIGERNNIHDYDGGNYAYGDDLYYLNRDVASFDGEVRVGQVSGTYYIFNGGWRRATQLEYDTYDYEKNEPWPAGNDGDSKWSEKSGYCYVYESSSWRIGNGDDCALNLGGCTVLRQNYVVKNHNEVWYTCDSQIWRKATDVEKDTVAWKNGEFDGEIRKGQVNEQLYYFYDGNTKCWRIAEDVEKNTYDYENNKPWSAGKDGDSRWGAINAINCYVFENDTWRTGNETDCSLGLRGCTANRQDTIALTKNGNKYKCDTSAWRVATEIEYDTYQIKCLKDGKMVNGKIDSLTKYVCDDGVFRKVEEMEIIADSACTSYNRDVSLLVRYTYLRCSQKGWIFDSQKRYVGSVADSRDGHVYKTVGIGFQLWMAENLNYADSLNYPSMIERNWCDDDADSCAKYGRYYTWSATIDSVYWAEQENKCGWGEKNCRLPEKVQGICPKGWHVPSSKEWFTLYSNVGGKPQALMAKEEWTNGSDNYGFSALHAGRSLNGVNKDNDYAYFWTSTEEDATHANFWMIGPNSANLNNYYTKDDGFSVRCVKDEEE